MPRVTGIRLHHLVNETLSLLDVGSRLLLCLRLDKSNAKLQCLKMPLLSFTDDEGLVSVRGGGLRPILREGERSNGEGESEVLLHVSKPFGDE